LRFRTTVFAAVCRRCGPWRVFIHPLADLWRFDLSVGVWRQIEPTGDLPSPRWHCTVASHSPSRRAYIFGGAGIGPDCFDRSLWALDLDSYQWTRLQAEGEVPPSMQGATLSFDAEHNCLVLFGGLRHESPGDATMSSVWVFDLAASRWHCLEGGERLRRRDHVAVYDPCIKCHYVIGGQVTNDVANWYAPGRPVRSVAKIRSVESSRHRDGEVIAHCRNREPSVGCGP